MTAIEARRAAEALDWVRRVADPEFTAWEAHLAWLEADAANAAAFDRAALLIDTATEGLTRAAPQLARVQIEAVNDNSAEPPRRWGQSILAATAAAVLAAAAWVGLKPTEVPRLAVTTQAGQSRDLQLVDGSQISLNGASRIELEQANPRTVRLVYGEAYFSVRHQAANPFRVMAGGAVFQDVGTAFDIKRDRRGTEIAVAEGEVIFDPDHSSLTLSEGQAMRVAKKTATVRQIEPASAGAWRDGRLIYQDTSFPLVAEDITRTLGVPITIDESQRTRHFSGVLILTGDRKHVLKTIGTVMSVGLQREGQGWRMTRRAE